MPILGWRVHFTRRQLMMPRISRPMLQSLPVDAVAGWLDREGIEDGVPFLISPDGHYLEFRSLTPVAPVISGAFVALFGVSPLPGG